jgi:hypothetical protein
MTIAEMLNKLIYNNFCYRTVILILYNHISYFNQGWEVTISNVTSYVITILFYNLVIMLQYSMVKLGLD